MAYAALFFAVASHAARHNLNVAQASAAARVIDKVGSTLQSQKSRAGAKAIESLRALVSATPGAIESMNQQLLEVIQQIESDVETKIVAGFQATQSEVSLRISELTNATTTAVDDKSAADAADNAWFACVSIEKGKREAIEAAEVALQAAEESTVVPCQNQIDRSPYSYDPSAGADWGFACDNEAGTCDENLNAYETMINGVLSTLKTNVGAATASWQEAKTACQAARDDVVAKQTALDTANSEFNTQKSTCLTYHEQRQLAMCLFGISLQNKCAKASAYEAFVTAIDQVNGGEYSEPDRQEEWRTVSVTKCVLAAIAGGGDIDALSLDTCEAQVNYAGDVGTLDYQSDAFEEQTTPARFTCDETTIAFRGETWNVPTEVNAASSSYTIQEFTPLVALEVGLSPFDFCEATGAPGKE